MADRFKPITKKEVPESKTPCPNCVAASPLKHPRCENCDYQKQKQITHILAKSLIRAMERQ